MIRFIRIIFFASAIVCLVASSLCPKEEALDCDRSNDNDLSLLQVKASEQNVDLHAHTAGASLEQHIASALEAVAGPELRGLHWDPDMLIVGLENSSSTVVSRVMNRLGLLTSSVRYSPSIREISWAASQYVNPLLDHAGGLISEEGYRRNAEVWRKALEVIKVSSASTALNIMSANVEDLPETEGAIWGLQEPSLLYLLPAYDSVYKKQAKYLMVTVDPRKVCSSVTNLADSFKMFGPHVKGSNHSSEDCFGWWAGVMNNVLDLYERETRFKVVRFEDLALPALTPANMGLAVLECMANFAGLPELKDDLANQLLSGLRDPAILSEKFHSSFLQENYTVHTPVEEQELSELEASLRRRANADLAVRKALDRLGYRVSSHGLTPAQSPAVCSLR